MNFNAPHSCQRKCQVHYSAPSQICLFRQDLRPLSNKHWQLRVICTNAPTLSSVRFKTYRLCRKRHDLVPTKLKPIEAQIQFQNPQAISYEAWLNSNKTYDRQAIVLYLMPSALDTSQLCRKGKSSLNLRRVN